MKHSKQTNVCIQLTEFDLDAPNGGVAKGVVVAHPFLEGEFVSVRLQTPEEALAEGGYRSKRTKADNDKFFARRPTLEKLAGGYSVGRNNIEPMKPGAMMMFHGCVKDFQASADTQMPVWKAQYVENYGHGLNRAIEHGQGRVRVNETADGRVFASLELLRTGPEDVRFVTSLDEIKAFYEQEMHPQLIGVGENQAQRVPIGMVRLIDKNSKVQSNFIYTETTREAVTAEDGSTRTVYGKASGMQNFHSAFVEGRQSNGRLSLIGAALDEKLFNDLNEQGQRLAAHLRSELESGGMRIEMIPGQRITILGDSLQTLLDDRSQLHRNYLGTFVKVQDRDGNTQAIPGFQKMTVGMMAGKSFNGQPADVLLTTFVNDEFSYARTAEKIATPLHKPEFTARREQEQEQRAAQAAEAGGVDLNHEAKTRLSGQEQEQEQEYENEANTPF